MKKILLLSLIVSLSANAESTTSAKMYPVTYVHINTDRIVSSNHSFSLTNNSSIDENITVCYDLTVCKQWPYHVKHTSVCNNYNVSTGQTITDTRRVDVPINYYLMGWCHNEAQTRIVGAEYSIANNESDFEVGR